MPAYQLNSIALRFYAHTYQTKSDKSFSYNATFYSLFGQRSFFKARSLFCFRWKYTVTIKKKQKKNCHIRCHFENWTDRQIAHLSWFWRKKRKKSNVQLSEMNCSWLNWIDGTRTQNNPIQRRAEKMWDVTMSHIESVQNNNNAINELSWLAWRISECDANSDHTNSNGTARYGGGNEKRNGGLNRRTKIAVFFPRSNRLLGREKVMATTQKRETKRIHDWAKALAMNSSSCGYRAQTHTVCFCLHSIVVH